MMERTLLFVSTEEPRRAVWDTGARDVPFTLLPGSTVTLENSGEVWEVQAHHRDIVLIKPVEVPF